MDRETIRSGEPWRSSNTDRQTAGDVTAQRLLLQSTPHQRKLDASRPLGRTPDQLFMSWTLPPSWKNRLYRPSPACSTSELVDACRMLVTDVRPQPSARQQERVSASRLVALCRLTLDYVAVAIFDFSRHGWQTLLSALCVRLLFRLDVQI